jgi:hypothetical protein
MSGNSFVISKRARVAMRNVTTIAERIRQVRKFKTGKIALEKHFSTELLRVEYTPPRVLVVRVVAKAMILSPILTILYILELSLSRVLTLRDDTFNALYTPYTSSKQLAYENE